MRVKLIILNRVFINIKMIFDNLEVLCTTDTKGRQREWKIYVVENEDKTATIITSSGIVGKKQLETRRDITCGKNIGRRNESTPFSQAVAEAKSTWKKKKDKTETSLPQDDQNKPQTVDCMLAHTFTKQSHKIKFPAFVQPKLDGVRAIVSSTPAGVVQIVSRGSKEFYGLDHIRDAILALELPTNIILDGELFTKNLSFEQITGMCRQVKNGAGSSDPESKKIEYHIYDCFNLDCPEMPFKDRFALIRNLVQNKLPLVLVETQEIDIPDEISHWYNEFFSNQGYEGAMVRNANGVYTPGRRSYDLQKMKEFQDKEFKIVGFKEAAGTDIGTIIWECCTESGKRFDVRPRGTREHRTDLLKRAQENFDNFLNKNLSVQFQDWTTNGIPRFPVGLAVRDYE